MANKRVLLMHISDVSGHRSASLAIEKALREIDGRMQIRNIDALTYTNPHWIKFISKLYIFVVRKMPRLWDYLYDNETVFRRIRKLRRFVHRVNDKKIKEILADFNPDALICTQAFPCGMLADYKHRHRLKTPLIGVLTDYAPHIYWKNDFVDTYVVPTAQIKQKMVQKGISPERLQTLGIPIDSKFIHQNNERETFRRLGLNPQFPVILIMGGGQGLGPIRDTVSTLDKVSRRVQLIVVCGTNRKLHKWLEKNKSLFRNPISVMGYTQCINDLMEISSFIVTKPGGLTSAEAMTKSLPIIIVSPLPGQETRNTQFLLEAKAALKADNNLELRSLAEELLGNPNKLEQLRKRTTGFAYGDSALKISQLVLDMLK